jgi:hypothetical protein
MPVGTETISNYLLNNGKKSLYNVGESLVQNIRPLVRDIPSTATKLANKYIPKVSKHELISMDTESTAITH